MPLLNCTDVASRKGDTYSRVSERAGVVGGAMALTKAWILSLPRSCMSGLLVFVKNPLMESEAKMSEEKAPQNAALGRGNPRGSAVDFRLSDR